MSIYEDVKHKLQRANQEHLLQFLDNLTSDEQTTFLNHLNSIDYEEANDLYAKAMSQPITIFDGFMEPILINQLNSEHLSTSSCLASYRQIGYNEISDGHVGVLLLAGGQGTRLGVEYPKGMYSLDLPSGKTLFQIQAERIRRIEELAYMHTKKRGAITWYIMTSESTDLQTNDFFRQNNFFSLNPNNVVFFEQGVVPCFDLNGKIILEDKNKVALAPDGNGGLYRALREKNILEDMCRRNIRYIHVHSVDNVLVKVADPIFIGYCVNKNADCGAKIVKKLSPREPIGVVCQINNLYQVVEYSEISERNANMRDELGNLVFNAGSICNHFFTTQFLFNIATQYEAELKVHVARKRIPCVNDLGLKEVPADINGIKIEKFIFDVFPFSENFVTWEVPRWQEFSALKNMNDVGIDCPATARKDLFALHKEYVEKAGGTVNGDVVEISPLLSYAGEGMESRVNGRVFQSPVYFS